MSKPGKRGKRKTPARKRRYAPKAIAPKRRRTARVQATPTKKRARAGERERRSNAARKGWETRRARQKINEWAKKHAQGVERGRATTEIDEVEPPPRKRESIFAHDDPDWEPSGGWQGEDYYDEPDVEFMTKDEIYEHYELLADRLEVPISDIYRMAAGYEPLH